MTRRLPKDGRVDELTRPLTDFDPTKAAERLKTALARERGNASRPDGWSRGGDGTGGGGPKITVRNELDDLESVDVTGVELAVFQRQRQHDDNHTVACTRAAQALETASRAISALTTELEIIDSIQALVDEDLDPDLEPGCWAMARVDSWEAIFRNTEIPGIAETKFPLGRWAYDFVTRTGRLPTTEECERHKAGQRVRLPAEVVTRWQQTKA